MIVARYTFAMMNDIKRQVGGWRTCVCVILMMSGMEIRLKINDVLGMDDDGRHILRVDCEEVRRMLRERKIWEELLADPTLRNDIYMQEKARREAKAERRKRQTEAEIAKRRRHDQFIASRDYRRHVDFIHDILGWNNEE